MKGPGDQASLGERLRDKTGTHQGVLNSDSHKRPR